MLSDKEIEAKIAELGGDALYLRGHKTPNGCAWEILLKAPELSAWEAYQRHKEDPSAQYAFVMSMVVWCSSDVVKTNGDAREAYAAVRRRFVAAAEALTSLTSFQQFVGLEAHAFEK